MSYLLVKRVQRFFRSVQKKRYLYLNKPKFKTLAFLIILSGLFCFKAFLPQVSLYLAEANTKEETASEKEFFGSKAKASIQKGAEKNQEKLLAYADPITPRKNVEAKKKPSKDEMRLYEIVGNAPIKEMVPFIAKHDREVAALTIGIAKKESDWGRRSPSKNGEDCFNYWGYKGSGNRGVAMGYACFASAEEAVKIVAGRIGHFVDKNLNTPAEMVVWKCGSSCAWDNPANVQKWVSDVSKYYNQIAYAK